MSVGSEEQFYITSGTSGASPGESPYLNRVTWASYKALSRGQLGGLALGALLGLGVGIATAGMGLFAGLGVPAAAAVALGFTAIGAKYYHDVFKQVGASSGAVAAGMEINEERSKVMNIKLDTILNVMAREGKISGEEIKKIEDDVEAVYEKGHHNFEKKFIDKPGYFWSIGTVGALAGLAIVAAIGGVAYLGEFLVHGAAPHITSAMVGMGATTLAGGALAGATYGINRHYYRKLFNFTNAAFEGDPSEIAKQRAHQMGLVAEPELPDFTPLPGIDGVQRDIQPGNYVSSPALIDNAQSREILARRIGTTWEELLQRRAAEEAARAQQQPRVH